MQVLQGQFIFRVQSIKITDWSSEVNVLKSMTAICWNITWNAILKKIFSAVFSSFCLFHHLHVWLQGLSDGHHFSDLWPWGPNLRRRKAYVDYMRGLKSIRRSYCPSLRKSWTDLSSPHFALAYPRQLFVIM